MASPAKRRPENISGSFYVDSTCIDCDTCRWMAPETFTGIGDQSAVYKQPESPEQKIKATQALISCPTASITAVIIPQNPTAQLATSSNAPKAIS